MATKLAKKEGVKKVMVKKAFVKAEKKVIVKEEAKKGVYLRERICEAKIIGISPYSQSKVMESEKMPKEDGDAYDARCWREHAHVNDKGVVVIPAASFKKALESAARLLKERVPGKGQSEYGKHFKVGVMIMENPSIGVKFKDLKCEKIYANADGKSGSGSRVWRRYPLFKEWSCVVRFVILDDTISKEVFERHLEEAGRLVGIGRWRGENGGMYGRFLAKTKWL